MGLFLVAATLFELIFKGNQKQSETKRKTTHFGFPQKNDGSQKMTAPKGVFGTYIVPRSLPCRRLSDESPQMGEAVQQQVGEAARERERTLRLP